MARKLVPTMLPLVALQCLNLKHLVVVDVQRCLIHVDRKLRLVFLHLALGLGPHVHGVLRHGVLENSATSSGVDVERGISLPLRVEELGTLHVARSSSDSRVGVELAFVHAFLGCVSVLKGYAQVLLLRLLETFALCLLLQISLLKLVQFLKIRLVLLHVHRLLDV